MYVLRVIQKTSYTNEKSAFICVFPLSPLEKSDFLLFMTTCLAHNKIEQKTVYSIKETRLEILIHDSLQTWHPPVRVWAHEEKL